MPRRAAALLAGAVLFALAPIAASAPACDVTGTWSDDYGTLFLRMTPGGSVSGNYTWQNGTLSGVMEGAFLNGTWAEEPTFAAPRDAGRFSFEFGSDCSAFTGTYWYAESPESPAGGWSGTRISTPEPPDPSELPPACDPRGEWSTNHGGAYFFAHDDLADLQAQWLLEDEVATLAGSFAGPRFEGTWTHPGRAAGSQGHFVVVFDARCETFRGDWTDDALIHNWNGTIVEHAPAREPEPLAPTESTEEPTPGATPTEHLPGVGEDPDDPAGIPGPGPLLVAVAAGLALVLARRRR